MKRMLWITSGITLAVVIVFGFFIGRREVAREAEREAPVTAPSRLREVRTPQGEEPAIVLDSAGERRMDIRTIVVAPATRHATTISLTGELIADPARITTIRAAVPGRVTAEGVWPALGQALDSGRVLAQISDARPLVVPRPGIVTRVSAQPGELVQAGQELIQVTDFRDPLARVVWRIDLPLAPPRTLTISPLGAPGSPAGARYVAPDAEADTVTGAPAFLYRVSANRPDWRPGLPMMATVQDPRTSVSALFVPTDAVVQWEGLSWVYVQRAVSVDAAHVSGHAYVRVRVDTSRPADGGWLVPQGSEVAAGDAIVVRGAQQLLSEEFRARIQVGEKGERS